jgi:hypothetical protein
MFEKMMDKIGFISKKRVAKVLTKAYNAEKDCGGKYYDKDTKKSCGGNYVDRHNVINYIANKLNLKRGRLGAWQQIGEDE